MAITPCKSEGPDLDTLNGLLKAAVAAQLALGKEVLNLMGTGARSTKDALGGIKMPKMGGCCEIPEACWMPKSLGEVSCRLPPDGRGEVRLIVTNGDYRSHKTVVKSAGAQAGAVGFQPAGPVALGPKERAVIVAEIKAPKALGHYEGVIWVSVCSDHYLRWSIDVAEEECGCCCYEVTVDDTPDYESHWYDHFYCLKPCMSRIAASDQ